MFSINEVNRNSDLLPNMSLIFTFSALSCNESQLKSFIHLSLQDHDYFPNYICNDYICGVALVGLKWETTLTLYTILNNFMSHQVSVCVYGMYGMCVCVCVCMVWCLCSVGICGVYICVLCVCVYACMCVFSCYFCIFVVYVCVVCVFLW